MASTQPTGKGEMPAGADCRQFAQEILDKTVSWPQTEPDFLKALGSWALESPLALLGDFQGTCVEGKRENNQLGCDLLIGHANLFI